MFGSVLFQGSKVIFFSLSFRQAFTSANDINNRQVYIGICLWFPCNCLDTGCYKYYRSLWSFLISWLACDLLTGARHSLFWCHWQHGTDEVDNLDSLSYVYLLQNLTILEFYTYILWEEIMIQWHKYFFCWRTIGNVTTFTTWYNYLITLVQV